MGPAQTPLNWGLACTALVLVPANLATLGVPYCASLPKVWKVLGSTFPKFHTHEVWCDPSAEGCGLSDQNG
jgi:hypothetical protein